MVHLTKSQAPGVGPVPVWVQALRGSSRKLDRLQAISIRFYRRIIMLKKEARQITGGLSKPSKMPGPAHNLPAVACKTGAKLVKIPGSVCAGCYALKGRYRFNNVQAALKRRLQALEDPRWVDAMVTLITGEKYFRWHDSGDIQSLKHLENIFRSVQAYTKTQALDANA